MDFHRTCLRYYCNISTAVSPSLSGTFKDADYSGDCGTIALATVIHWNQLSFYFICFIVDFVRVDLMGLTHAEGDRSIGSHIRHAAFLFSVSCHACWKCNLVMHPDLFWLVLWSLEYKKSSTGFQSQVQSLESQYLQQLRKWKIFRKVTCCALIGETCSLHVLYMYVGKVLQP